MKFAEHLSAHITPEWRKQYINYELLFKNKQRLSLLKLLDYIGASTSNSGFLVECEEVPNEDNIIMCGKTSSSPNSSEYDNFHKGKSQV